MFKITSVLLCILLCTACREPAKPAATLFSGSAMTIDWQIQVGDPVSHRQKIEELINRTFQEINEIYNRWNPQSELSRLNQLKAHQTQEISPELAHFLAVTHEFVQLSGGYFDPTVEPLQVI